MWPTSAYWQKLIHPEAIHKYMAKARMLHKQISTSEDVSNLPLQAQLLFSWLIPHADDDGRLKGTPKYIKATIVPYFDWSFEEIKTYLEQMHKLGLIYYWQDNNEFYIEFVKWTDYQSIRKDRYEPSKLPSYSNDNQLTTTRQPSDNQSTPQSNVIEVNEIKDNKSESNGTTHVADKNSDKDDSLSDNLPQDINSKHGLTSYELWKRMDKGNFKAMPRYNFYVKHIPENLLYQWASEIEQDNTVRVKGAVFVTKAEEYLKQHNSLKD